MFEFHKDLSACSWIYHIYDSEDTHNEQLWEEIYTEKIERNINGQPFVKNSDHTREKVSGLKEIIAKYTYIINSILQNLLRYSCILYSTQ